MATPLPQDLIDRAKRLVTVHGICTTADILGLNRCAIYWMKKRGWKQGEPNPRRPRPSDFAIQVRHMKHAELRKYYGASSEAVTRWRRELQG